MSNRFSHADDNGPAQHATPSSSPTRWREPSRRGTGAFSLDGGNAIDGGDSASMLGSRVGSMLDSRMGSRISSVLNSRMGSRVGRRGASSAMDDSATGTVIVNSPQTTAPNANIAGNNQPPPALPFGTLFSPWTPSPMGVQALNGNAIPASVLHVNRPTTEEIQLATQPRRVLIGVLCFLYLLCCLFLLLAQLGSTSTQSAVTGLYLYRFNITSIFPSTDSGTDLANAVAREIGLHDIYQAGLWGYCEGYRVAGDAAEGIRPGVDFTDCSRPRSFYWFNPMEILLDELLAGSSIVFPTNALTVLTVLRVIMQVMFGAFLLGIVLDFVLLLVSPVVLWSRWWSLAVSLLAGASALLTLAGATIATVVTLAFRIGVSAISEIDVGLTIGTPMFVFVWAATALGLVAFVLHTILGCCGASIRDIETGHLYLVRANKAARAARRRRRSRIREQFSFRNRQPYQDNNENRSLDNAYPDALPLTSIPSRPRAPTPRPESQAPISPPPAYSGT